MTPELVDRVAKAKEKLSDMYQMHDVIELIDELVQLVLDDEETR